MPVSTGPSIRGVCRILNRNSCGSGSICGHRNGKTLILSNAHVCGTKIGRIVDVEVESNGDKFKARVIMAAYSDRTMADWAILETVNDYNKVKPVYLSKKQPTGSHYTKGFPRCRPHNGTDIATQSFRPPVWFWEPDAIGGQSGSGVWSDIDDLQYGILTWQWGQHGAGQMTSEIYKQARNRTTAGWPRIDGLLEVWDFDIAEDERGETNPEVENGFFAIASIADLPIWAEDIVVPPPVDPVDPVDPPSSNELRSMIAEDHRRQMEFHESRLKAYEATPDNNDSMPNHDRPDDIPFW